MKSGEEDNWTMRKTAALIGSSLGSVSQDITLAEALEKLPDLLKCKTKKEAIGAINQLQEKDLRAELVRRAEKAEDFKSDQIYNYFSEAYRIGDFFTQIRKISDETIDLVECDPPYGIDFDSWTSNANKNPKEFEKIRREEFTELPASEYEEKLEKILSECYRVMKPNSWLVLWYACEPWAEVTYQKVIGAGFKTSRVSAVWNKAANKTHGFMSGFPDYYLGRAHENFYYCRKGEPVLYGEPARADVFTFSQPKDRIHLTEKPVELMMEIYKYFSLPGSKILIPFLGSGNGLLAAAKLRCHATGFDLSKDHKNRYLLRLKRWLSKETKEEK